MITFSAGADEVSLRLDLIPKRIRAVMTAKFVSIFDQIKADMFDKKPGRYLDKNFVESGVTEIGGTIYGFIEATDKPGHYPIVPVKARLLRFVAKDGAVIRTKFVAHPYLKGSPIIEREIDAKLAWIQDELDDAAFDATYNT